MKRITINISDEQWEKLQEIVNKQDSDISKQIRKAIAMFLETRG